MQLLSSPPHSTYLRRESPFTLACKPRSAIWELGVFFWRLVRIEAVACWNNKQVNILTMHNSLSLGHLNVLKMYSSSGQKTSSRLCPGRVETQRQTSHDEERDVSRELKSERIYRHVTVVSFIISVSGKSRSDIISSTTEFSLSYTGEAASLVRSLPVSVT